MLNYGGLERGDVVGLPARRRQDRHLAVVELALSRQLVVDAPPERPAGGPQAGIADYSTFELAEAAGFPPEALVEDDHERCQAEAAWLQAHHVRGVLSPSAALPGSVNLTLFGPRVELKWERTQTLASQMRVHQIARTSPPAGLTDEVRYFGEEHAGLAAFRAERRERRREEL